MALQKSITVTSTADGNFQDYDVTSKPDWITVSKQGGAVTVIASENTGDARSGTIVFTQQGSGKTVSVSVSQEADEGGGVSKPDNNYCVGFW